MRSLIKLVLAILIAWFTIVVVIPALAWSWVLYKGVSANKEKQQVKETKSIDCIKVLYTTEVDPYTNKKILKKIEQAYISFPYSGLEYYKANSAQSTFTYRLTLKNVNYFPTSDPRVKIDLSLSMSTVSTIDASSIKRINFKVKDSTEEVSLAVSMDDKQGYYFDFSKGTENYETLSNLATSSSTPVVAASSISIINKKSPELVTASFGDNGWGDYTPFLVRLKELTHCVNNPPKIPKDFIVVE
jgi:hypothetical protein